jgi:hypothetical protein
MKQKTGPSQRTSSGRMGQWDCSGRNYTINQIISNHEADSMHIRAMCSLVSPGLLKPGIPGGNPLKEMN